MKQFAIYQRLSETFRDDMIARILRVVHDCHDCHKCHCRFASSASLEPGTNRKTVNCPMQERSHVGAPRRSETLCTASALSVSSEIWKLEISFEVPEPHRAAQNFQVYTLSFQLKVSLRVRGASKEMGLTSKQGTVSLRWIPVQRYWSEHSFFALKQFTKLLTHVIWVAMKLFFVAFHH